ncbi:MAG: MogA/MoaB family molybdenum cofactor biosynthesis protein [Anaerolineales bacterium]|nr:MogA/MoaB family molybdenum cofactor biosynthesis protein [Anaerolineales bacterium]
MELKIGIITVSDRSSRGERPDQSGPELTSAVRDQGWLPLKVRIVPDDLERIKETLIDWCDQENLDVILTTGGTGFSPRDVTPEATREVIDRQAPGLAEAMRAASLKITPHAMLSRAVVGIRKRTLIINFPGSPQAAKENFQVVAPVLPHAAELLREEESAESSHRKLQ